MGFLQRIDEKSKLFGRMSEHAGVDFRDTGGFTLEQDIRRAITRCMFCRHAQACGQWLNADEAGLYPGFCPNAAFFDRYGTAGQQHSMAA